MGKYHDVMGSDGKVHLKESSPWFTQIQTLLGLTGYSWCDFVLFTRKEPCLTIERIHFKKSWFETKVSKALNFYELYVYKRLLNHS